MCKAYVPNPAVPAGRKPVHILTDRALRYRANSPALRPPGEGRCTYCGNPNKRVEVEHINGHEEDLDPANLCWSCRSCNTSKGAALKKAGLGRRTRQYNPSAEGAKSLGQWMTAVMAAKGRSSDMKVSDAVAMIRATPAAKRSEFAREIWRIRRKRGTDTQVPF